MRKGFISITRGETDTLNQFEMELLEYLFRTRPKFVTIDYSKDGNDIIISVYDNGNKREVVKRYIPLTYQWEVKTMLVIDIYYRARHLEEHLKEVR